MSIQTVNLGTYANDGTGDDLRTAFEKVVGNFDYLDLIKAEDGENLGTAIPNTHGVYAGVDGVTLQFKSIKQGDNITITSDGNTITLRPKDSINAVEEDPNPKLGGDLNTGGFDIYSEGLPLNLYVKDNNLNIYNYDTSTGDYLPLALNALNIIGNNFNSPGTTTIATYLGDGLTIQSDQDFTLSCVNGTIYFVGAAVSDSSITATEFIGPLTGNVTGNTNGTHTGPVVGSVTGDVLGNVTGDLNGTVTGNVLGQVSDISNHNLRDLGDVSNTLPGVGNGLIWNGSAWAPGAVQPGVTQIIAGTNVSISPFGGTGAVTINVPSVATTLDSLTDVAITVPEADQVLKYNGTTWVNATSPAGIPSISDFDLGVIGANITSPFQLLFQALNVDFETFDNPASYNVDLGTLGGETGPTEWTTGDVDGGSPSTSPFTYYIDGGSPTTTSFTAIADGGSIFGASVDGGSPSGSPSEFVDGGGPTSTPELIIDGGTPA